MAEIPSPGDWWVLVLPELVWWEVLGLGPVECEEPLKWVGAEARGSERESGLGLSSLAAPLLVPLPATADSVIRISTGLAAERGLAVLPQEEAKAQQGSGEGLPGVWGQEVILPLPEAAPSPSPKLQISPELGQVMVAAAAAAAAASSTWQ